MTDVFIEIIILIYGISNFIFWRKYSIGIINYQWRNQDFFMGLIENICIVITFFIIDIHLNIKI